MPARYVISEGMFLCVEHETRTVLFFVPAEGMKMDVVAQVMEEHNSTHTNNGGLRAQEEDVSVDDIAEARRHEALSENEENTGGTDNP